MVSARAKLAQQSDARKVRILDKHGAARWHPLWEGNLRIARPGEAVDAQEIVDGSGCRSYIAAQTPERWTWRANPREPGELYLTETEKAFGAQVRQRLGLFVVIEPHLKARASPNKQWGIERWKQFARFAVEEGYYLAQLGLAGTQRLPRVELVETPDPRRAAAVLSNASLYVGPDGFLHHAAAAFSVPAIVIRGAFISAEVTGYPDQRNLFTGEGLGCGMRVRCKCCEAAMAVITPEIVLDEIKELW